MSPNRTVSKLPHNSRRFSATGSRLVTAGLWLGLLAVIAVNSSLKVRTPAPNQGYLYSILSNPSSVEAHIALAQQYWTENNERAAKQELTIAQEIYRNRTSANVLGASSEPLSLMDQWQQQKHRQSDLYDFWSATVKQRPDYRDAYIQLASLAYQLERYEDAKKHLDTALRLDPNTPTARELEKLLQSLYP